MNIRILGILAAVLAGACSTASAALITYDLSGSTTIIGERRQVEPTFGYATFDDKSMHLVEFSLTHPYASFQWDGQADLNVLRSSTADGRYYTDWSVGPVDTGPWGFEMYFEMVSHVESSMVNPIPHLEGVAEGVFWTFIDAGAGYINEVSFRKAAQVPEPSTLALLGLGLLGFITNRRLS